MYTAWKYKFLWIFGFFVAVGNSYYSFTNYYDMDEVNFGDFSFGLKGDFSLNAEIIVLIMTIVILAAIILWIISILAEGALIHGINRIESNQKTDFSDCLTVGASKFLRLLGIMLIATFVVLLLIFGSLLYIIPSYFLSVALGIILTVIAIPLIIAAIFTIVAVEAWSIRYAVLHDTAWFKSISEGWNLFRKNIGSTIAVAFSSVIPQLIFWAATLIVALIIAVPFIILAKIELFLGLIPGALIVLTIGIFIYAYLGTFSSTIWTLAFMNLSSPGTEQPPQSPEVSASQ